MSETIEMNNAPILDSELGTKKVRSLLFKYSLASLAGISWQMIAAIFDGFFVGNGIGATGLATISIVFPLWMLVIALSMLFGVGASSQSAAKKGEGDAEGARQIFAKGFWYSIILSAIISIFVLTFTEQVVRFFGATDEFIGSAITYTRIYMVGFPFFVTGLYFYYYILVDEKPLIAAFAQIIPAVLGITFEYVFIFKLDFGIAGSPLASWGICVGGYFLLIFYFIFNKKTIFKIKLSDLKQITRHDLNQINKIGFAGFMTQISMTVASIIINNQIGVYGTDLDFAVYGVINAYLIYILVNITQAFIYGQLPIASYNYGAKRYARVVDLIKNAVIYSILTQVIVLLSMFVFADSVLMFFCGNDPELIAATKKVMYVFLLLYPLGGYTFVASGYFQALNLNGKALVNGCSRYIIFVIPLLFILPQISGLHGIWIAQPIADTLSFVCATVFMYHETDRLKKLAYER